jgi:hypothetical protein
MFIDAFSPFLPAMKADIRYLLIGNQPKMTAMPAAITLSPYIRRCQAVLSFAIFRLMSRRRFDAFDDFRFLHHCRCFSPLRRRAPLRFRHRHIFAMPLRRHFHYFTFFFAFHYFRHCFPPFRFRRHFHIFHADADIAFDAVAVIDIIVDYADS